MKRQNASRMSRAPFALPGSTAQRARLRLEAFSLGGGRGSAGEALVAGRQPEARPREGIIAHHADARVIQNTLIAPGRRV